MKKSIYILVLTIFLSGCTALQNVTQLVASPTAPPPAHTQTPFVSVTPIPTQNLFATSTSTPLTFTPTVTQIGAELFTPTQTETPLPIATVGLPASALGGSYFTPVNTGFLAVTTLIVWGSTCDGARSIKFTAQVMPARRLKYVTLWYRLQDKYSGRHTDWGGGAILSDNDQGTYFYDLDLSQINDYRFFEDAWFQYQLVASTVTRRVLGRSVVSRTEISLTHCKVFNP